MRAVPFEWALRDIAQGWRGIVVLLVALIPTFFVLLIHFTVEPVPADQRDMITSTLIANFIVPVIVGGVAILAGGTVMRAPLEDGTLIYQLIRPVNRVRVGLQRMLAVVLVVTLATVLSGVSLGILLGTMDIAVRTLLGLVLAGVAFGSLYGFIMSLHRFAIALPLIHVLLEWSLLLTQVPGIQRLTISWHVLGAMGAVLPVLQEEGLFRGGVGNPMVPVVVGLASVALAAMLFRWKRLHLGLPEA